MLWQERLDRFASALTQKQRARRKARRQEETRVTRKAIMIPDSVKTITLERTYHGAIEDVWELWTTKAGIESWWGPDGFTVKVLELEAH